MPRVLNPVDTDREREILYRVIQVASSSLEAEDILSSFVELVSQAVGCEICFVYLWDAEDHALVLRAAPADHARSVGRVRLRLGEGIAGWAAEHREPVLLRRDPMADPRYLHVPELRTERFRAMLSIPILSRTGVLIGVINVHSPHAGHFSDEDARFLEHAASLVAGGIENARLFELAARKEEALAALVRTTIQTQEEERRRVATEIHDGVTQQLVSIWYRVCACQRLLEQGQFDRISEELLATKQLLDETLAEARSAIYDLRPATLDDLGLVAALHELTARFRSETGIVAHVEAEEIRLSPHVETALYRVTQEGLTNVKKHAGAGSVSVRLRDVDGSVELTVADDGRGFDVAAYGSSRPLTSFGVAGMRERVELVGGELALRSRPRGGTVLTCIVPGDRAPAEEAAT
ncbi:MAG: GAF domain-containing sensor histidine kinase [Actinomycetota bacterium]